MLKLKLNFTKSIFKTQYTTKELGIHKTISNNLLLNFGIQQTTAAQSILIRGLLEEREMILKDMTGTGKTFASLVALLSMGLANESKQGITKLMLVPSRDLALQLRDWSKLLLFNRNLQDETQTHMELDPKLIQILYRDSNSELSQHKLISQFKPYLLIATPSKIVDLLKDSKINFNRVDTIVLDEIDSQLKLPSRYATLKERWIREKHAKPIEMIVNGILNDNKYKNSLENEIEGVETERKLNLVALSATINGAIKNYLRENSWMRKPVFVDAVASFRTPPTLTHWCLLVSANSIKNLQMKNLTENQTETIENQGKRNEIEELNINIEGDNLNTGHPIFKYDHQSIVNSLASIVIMGQIKESLVFLPDQMSAFEYCIKLKNCGLDARQLSDLYTKQYRRSPKPLATSQQEGIVEIKADPIVWVANVSQSRGIDLPYLTHVIVLGLPDSPAQYLHMAGRTARVGRHGTVILLELEGGNNERKISTMMNFLNANVAPCPFVEV